MRFSGALAEARPAARTGLALNPDFTVARFRLRHRATTPARHTAAHELFADALRAGGCRSNRGLLPLNIVPAGIAPVLRALIFSRIGTSAWRRDTWFATENWKTALGGERAFKGRLGTDRNACQSRHVWMPPADQGLFSGVAPVVGAVMSSASFCADNRVRWP